MTSAQILANVRKHSDVTWEEQPYESFFLENAIREAMQYFLASQLLQGNLHVGSLVYTRGRVVIGDIIGLSSGDFAFVIPAIPGQGYPLYWHMLGVYTTSDGLVRCSYVPGRQYWRHRKIINGLVRGHTRAYTIVQGEDPGTLRVVFNSADLNPQPFPLDDVVAEYGYWREPQFNALLNIVEIPPEYHETIVAIAIQYIQSGQFVTMPMVTGARGQFRQPIEAGAPVTMQPSWYIPKQQNGNPTSNNE
jgi:hypothetical protein